MVSRALPVRTTSGASIYRTKGVLLCSSHGRRPSPAEVERSGPPPGPGGFSRSAPVRSLLIGLSALRASPTPWAPCEVPGCNRPVTRKARTMDCPRRRGPLRQWTPAGSLYYAGCIGFTRMRVYYGDYAPSLQGRGDSAVAGLRGWLRRGASRYRGRGCARASAVRWPPLRCLRRGAPESCFAPPVAQPLEGATLRPE
jgi:hypothetical protein